MSNRAQAALALPVKGSSKRNNGDMQTTLPPVPRCNPRVVATLHADLVASGWSPSNLGISQNAADCLRDGDPAPAKLELERMLAADLSETERGVPAVLTKLFLTGQTVTADVFMRALPTLGLRGAGLLGIVKCDGMDDDGIPKGEAPEDVTVFPRVSIEPVDLADEDGPETVFLVADLGPTQTGKAPYPDQVLGMTGAARTMLHLLPKIEVDRALDLGCGSGVLAMQMGLRAKETVATDVSDRACGFAQFNATLNGFRLDIRRGSLFEPVKDKRFDLIASNPPFALAPAKTEEDDTYTYRQSTAGGKQLMADVVAGAVDHLDEGGLAVLMGNWPVTQAESESDDAQAGDDGRQADWSFVPAEWVRSGADTDQPLSAYIAQRDSLTADQYARWWAHDQLGPYPTAEGWQEAYGQWLTDLEKQNVDLVGLGFIAMTRPTSVDAAAGRLVAAPDTDKDGTADHAHMLVAEDVSTAQPLDGAALLRALDNLAAPAEWTEVAYRKVDGAYEERTFTPGDPNPKTLTLIGSGSGSRRLNVPVAVSAFVGVCDGEVTASQVVPAIAHLLDEDEREVREQIATYLPVLIRAGILTT